MAQQQKSLDEISFTQALFICNYMVHYTEDNIEYLVVSLKLKLILIPVPGLTTQKKLRATLMRG
jgi:hypothetical protein